MTWFPLLPFAWGVHLMIRCINEPDETKSRSLYLEGLLFLILAKP